MIIYSKTSVKVRPSYESGHPGWWDCYSCQAIIHQGETYIENEFEEIFHTHCWQREYENYEPPDVDGWEGGFCDTH